MTNKIIQGSEYGDARKQASRETPHGLTPSTIESLGDRMEQFLPGLTEQHGQASRQFFDGLLPDGAELDPRQRRRANIPAGATFSNSQVGGGNTSITPQRPYQPEFECVLEGTSVVMADGTLKNIEQVRVGDKVLDKNGNEQEVLRHWCSGVPNKLVELRIWGGNKLYSTTNHNFPVYIDNTLKKIPAGEIDSGYLIIPRKFDVSNTSVSTEEARLLGYYLAEGSLLKNRSDLPYSEVEFTLSLLEKDTIAKDIKTILSNKNIDFNVTEILDKNVIRIRTRGDNSQLVEWLFTNGNHLNNLKAVSKEVLGWPVKLKIELIKGLLRGDGSQFYKVSRTKGKEGNSFEVTHITASKNLSSQVRLILAQIGYPSRCIQTKSGFDKKAGFRRNPHYRLTITGQYARDIADLVWEENSKSALIANKNIIKHKCLMDDDFIYTPIKKVTIINNKIGIPVYNMTVSGDHSYLIENIGTYNSPDRQQYPVHRILANRYWRLFYKLDPVIGNCIDMYSSMPWSDFQLTGEGVTGEIKESFETMCQETNVLQTLEYMVKEFLAIGEAAPHNFFDESKGIWTYTSLHNPDQLEVIDAPFIKMEPVVEFIPDDRLRAVLTSSNHLLRKIRDQMPPELISRLIARQNIPLSPINMTFIPRRMHPYDTRGTSIISRMWRILMYEDAVYNASIATARRHAGPIKVAKLGNPQTGWIPSQEHERRLLQLLAQAELDVNAWLVYHYGINFEMVGTTDRIINISQHHEVIERVKLIAMGISKSFLHGEVTYASSVTGLSVFLQRMKAMRNFFVNTWLIPKFFKPIAKINGWVRRDQKELNFRYRIKRSQREIELENRWIVPKVEWEKQLDHTVNTELITAMNTLETGLGIKFSKTTKYATVNKKFEEEIRKIKEEQKYEHELNQYIPPEELAGGPAGGAPGGGGLPPPPPKPGMPAGPPAGAPAGAQPGKPGQPGQPGMPAPGMGAGPSSPTGLVPGGAPTSAPPGGVASADDKNADGGGTGPSGKKDPAVRDAESQEWDDKGRSGNWTASEVLDLTTLIREGHTDSPVWGSMDMSRLRTAIDAGDALEVLEVIEEHLELEGYPPSDIRQLRRLLDREGVLKDIVDGETARLRVVEDSLGDATGSLNDSQMMDRMASHLDGERPDPTKLGNPDFMVVGPGNENAASDSPWSGDISHLIND